MPGSLEDKVALVTGSGSGIGRAAALAFAREGTRVVVSDVNPDAGEETVGKIEEAGGHATFIHVDVSKATAVEEMVDKAVEVYGKLDCAHNNAGIEGVTVPIHEYPEEVWDRVIAINLKGVWLCMKYEIRQMLRRGGGAVVNTSSIAGLVGTSSGICAYIACKHGVVGITKTAALEYAQQGIRINAVCPGLTDTPMADRLLGGDQQAAARIAATYPLARFGAPEEVAEAVIWLCSDASSFVTGHALSVDGGYVAQ